MTRTVFVEVTNTLAAPSTTGIQRVVVELLRRLTPDSPIPFIPITWIDEVGAFRRLTEQEHQHLLSSRVAPPSQPGSARDFFGSVPGAKEAVRSARRLATRVSEMSHSDLKISAWPDGAIFLDIEASWHSPLLRSELLPGLRRQGIPVVSLHHDLFPVEHPEWFEAPVVDRFRDYIDAHLRHSSLTLCNSAFTERQVSAYAEQHLPDRSLVTSVLHLGADFNPPANTPAPVPDVPFMLCVGTIEPRKNQGLLLDALDILADHQPDVHLVIAGRQGWNVDDLVTRIRQHHLCGSRLHWLERASDSEIEDLYTRCLIAVVPSRAEGFGLPVVEALQRGAAVIAATGGALMEAGGDMAEYIDPDGPEMLAELVMRHSSDAEYHASRVAMAADYAGPTWQRCADELHEAVAGLPLP